MSVDILSSYSLQASNQGWPKLPALMKKDTLDLHGRGNKIPLIESFVVLILTSTFYLPNIFPNEIIS